MKVLLDTHIAIWFVMNDRRLSARASKLMIDPLNDVYFSSASLWEISIKFALGRQSDPMPFSAGDALVQFQDADFEALPVGPLHAAAVDDLPPLHRDPFDRLLLAQTITEPMYFLTHDQRLAAYSSLVIVV